MEAALASGADGATWGMGPDIEDYEQAGPGQEVNWRVYVDKHSGSLTDRQTKLLDKIRCAFLSDCMIGGVLGCLLL